jgi:two-component system CheB/CheR fusion protein
VPLVAVRVDEVQAFEQLLEQLRASRSFDFTGYKRSSLMRRTRKRMSELGIDSFQEYSQLLDGDGGEFDALFNTILINVTSFFRDPLAWKVLEERIIPTLVDSYRAAPAEGPIRVWCAGCATGQEAFSVAMLFADVLGATQLSNKLKIYATDVDEEALAQARLATYPVKAAESVPDVLRARYFDDSGSRLTLVPDLRRVVIFGRHDLVHDPPISRISLLLCRNTLMYFNQALQRSVLDSFHFALSHGGYLCLGKSEMMVVRTGRFRAIDLKRRVFAPILDGAEYYPRRRMASDSPGDAQPSVSASMKAALKTHAFELNDIPQIVLDTERHLILANRRARDLFGLSSADIGRSVQDLELSYRPIELRSQIDQAESAGQPVVTRSVGWERDGTGTFWDITVATLSGRDATVGTMVAFVDVTDHHGIEDELVRLQREVQTAYGELQSTVEELETTNEELQSTNEELETTNEELQSTNEELETMNEELQSTNEELETMNDELRQRSTELNEVNFFFESVLASIQAGVAVTDPHLRIQVWNRESEQLWGLRADEVRGQDLLSLDIGLPVAELREPARACLSGGSTQETLTVDAINRLGRPILCKVSIMPLANDGKVQGAIILMDAEQSG